MLLIILIVIIAMEFNLKMYCTEYHIMSNTTAQSLLGIASSRQSVVQSSITSASCGHILVHVTMYHAPPS